MYKFETLYKQTSTGAIQQWTITVDGCDVITEYGLVDGKKQTTRDTVKAGKNLGRSSATTPEEQAHLQAMQDYERKLKKGYVVELDRAVAHKNNLQAVEPMLAHPIEKKERYVTFPAYAQPKLDGLRCIAVIKGGKARLFSRTQKEFTTVPHIAAELEELWAGGDIILDGELYSHTFKDDFNAITQLIKRDELHPDHRKIEYHQYDVVGPGGYAARAAILRSGTYCRIVETMEVRSRPELESYQLACIERGYEGCMYRNPASPYEHKRSAGLLKVKTFQDAEFWIVGAEEGTGKLMGALGAFVLAVSKGGPTFGAKPACTLAQAQAYWRDRETYIGRRGTVKFQNLTPDGVPRFPVFKCVREVE